MKSIWKSKSFITGLGSLLVAIAFSQGIDIPPTVVEGILSVIAMVLIGKSANKRMKDVGN